MNHHTHECGHETFADRIKDKSKKTTKQLVDENIRKNKYIKKLS